MPLRSGRTPGTSSERFVIASTGAWNRDLVRRLRDATGHDFFLISDPADLTRERLAQIRPRYVFFPHWSRLIPPEIYANHACVIFHMTDLPYGRGGSPLQNLISRGHTRTKISAIRCAGALDAGPVYLKRDLTLQGSAEEIFIRASGIIEDMIKHMIAKNPKPRPQRGKPVVFKRRKPADGNLTQAKSLDEAFDLIRMLDAEDYPAAFLTLGSLRLEFTRASRKVDSVIADVRITLSK